MVHFLISDNANLVDLNMLVTSTQANVLASLKREKVHGANLKSQTQVILIKKYVFDQNEYKNEVKEGNATLNFSM